MNYYSVLDSAQTVDLEEVHKLLVSFINKAVVKEKRKRWIELSRNPQKLYKKFNGLWSSLDFKALNKSENLELEEQSYIYYNLYESGFLLGKTNAEQVYPGRDGFLFGLKTKDVYFLTHESIYYQIKIKD